MKLAKLDNMQGGWFVGDFFPRIFHSPAFEVAVKSYKAGDEEEWHVHKIAFEITVVLDGTVIMAGQQLGHGDIILLEPGEGTSFKAITDVKTVVVKSPSVAGDKYTSSS